MPAPALARPLGRGSGRFAYALPSGEVEQPKKWFFSFYVVVAIALE